MCAVYWGLSSVPDILWGWSPGLPGLLKTGQEAELWAREVGSKAARSGKDQEKRWWWEGTSGFALAKLLASWQLDIQGYVRETGWAFCWDTLRQLCNGKADLSGQHGNGSWICAGSREGPSTNLCDPTGKSVRNELFWWLNEAGKKSTRLSFLGVCNIFYLAKICNIEVLILHFKSFLEMHAPDNQQPHTCYKDTASEKSVLTWKSTLQPKSSFLSSATLTISKTELENKCFQHDDLLGPALIVDLQFTRVRVPTESLVGSLCLCNNGDVLFIRVGARKVRREK